GGSRYLAAKQDAEHEGEGADHNEDRGEHHQLAVPDPELVAGGHRPATGDPIDSGARMPSRPSPCRMTWPTARTRASRARVSSGASGRTTRKAGVWVPRWW